MQSTNSNSALEMTCERLQFEYDALGQRCEDLHNRLVTIEQKRFPLLEFLSATVAILVAIATGTFWILHQVESNTGDIKALNVSLAAAQKYNEGQFGDLKTLIKEQRGKN